MIDVFVRLDVRCDAMRLYATGKETRASSHFSLAYSGHTAAPILSSDADLQFLSGIADLSQRLDGAFTMPT